MAATTEPARTVGSGRYRMDRLIGARGMAAVWLAHDARLRRPVVVKEMAAALADDDRFAERFLREARIAASLSHPNLVRVFDFAVEDGRPFLVMEHVGGATLAGRLDRGRGAGDCTVLARALLGALAHMHAAGIVHRDVKPANVLVGADGRPRITDFGVARVVDAGRLSRAGRVVGSARHLAPEVLAGEEATPAADLYGLGLLLRRCAGGDGPPRLERLVGRLLARDPADRPLSAVAALLELGEPPATSPAAVPRRVAERPHPPARAAVLQDTAELAAADRPRRRPRALAVTALAAASLGAALAGLVAVGGEPAPPDAPAAARDAGAGAGQVDHGPDGVRHVVRPTSTR